MKNSTVTWLPLADDKIMSKILSIWNKMPDYGLMIQSDNVLWIASGTPSAFLCHFLSFCFVGLGSGGRV